MNDPLWVLSLVFVWLLIDYPYGFWLFCLGAWAYPHWRGFSKKILRYENNP